MLDQIGPSACAATAARPRPNLFAVLVGSAVGRAVVAFLMIATVSGDSLLLFPEAFVMLVLAKTYQVAKAAIVPTVVESDAGLVEANSKLQLLSGLAAIVAGARKQRRLLEIGRGLGRPVGSASDIKTNFHSAPTFGIEACSA